MATNHKPRGPPPPARGAQCQQHSQCAVPRTTPACAGSTYGAALRANVAADHPRLRGEHRGRTTPSSVHRRTTPACAGSTVPDDQASEAMADHPRLRGEHLLLMATNHKPRGPPPPARGAQCQQHSQCAVPRTTPACAGSTYGAALRANVAADHPRLRGEHRGRTTPSSVHRRTTPACAGSTVPDDQASEAMADHPRLRGEHRARVMTPPAYAGPPPPARGALAAVPSIVFPQRTTPACAGSTSPLPCAPCGSPDHPRLRGEHVLELVPDGADAGPPPPARGAPLADLGL